MVVTLRAEKRAAGKAKIMRRSGLLPAIVYGKKEESTPITLNLKQFEKAFEEAGESSVIELEGLGTTKDVLIHDVAFDPVLGKPVHVDLYAIEKGQKVEVGIPIEFEGVSPAVKDLGGILVKVIHELEVEAEPKNLPREIIIDISVLADLESQIHVRDIKLPAGVIAKIDGDDVVAMIDVAKEEPTEEAPVDISQIEISEERGKKEEEGEGETAGETAGETKE